MLLQRFRFVKETKKLLKFVRCYSNRNVLKLHERGFYAELFPSRSADEVADLLNGSDQTVYAGFDPTADSLHIGNLLVLINLLHWQRAGHKVIALLGGATAQIGDPSGRNKDRPEMLRTVVEHNAEKIEHSIRVLFENHLEYFCDKADLPKNIQELQIVNNIDWYNDMSALYFINNIGRNFRLGPLLGKQSIRDRLNSEHGLSYTEFSYQILQAYDWLHLYQNHNCHFQVGGNDQLGNIVSGYDLIQKFYNKPVYGLTVPLITTEEGDKFGKSAGNAIWLSKEKTSAFQLYQFFIRIKDSDVQKLLMLFTFETMPKILEIMNEHWKTPHKRLAQKILAENIIKLVHGAKGLEQAENVTAAVYENNVEHLKNLDPLDLKCVFEGASFTELLLQPGTTILEAAIRADDAIRIISQGGFYINHQRINNFQEVISMASHILPNNVSLMRVGKKNYTIVKWS
ncbi:hypothetical protein RUM43_004306 [Polyplax serrata]|uniref:Tyrosine--tRNA ligase n=1 Tax=Polyplax serrata TaxID=468196 RepID=A0AAN8XLA3_POLSC